MIIDKSAGPIIERYKAALAESSAAVTRLHAALASGERNEDVLLRLTEEMERTHHAALLIRAELAAVRLDKSS
ncbi:MAG: hypothetical protein WA190_00035 [Usitatibacter sp.]